MLKAIFNNSKSVSLFHLKKNNKNLTNAFNEINTQSYSNKAQLSPNKQPSEQKQLRKFKLTELLNDPNPERPKQPPKMDKITNKALHFYDPPYLEREAPFPNYEHLKLSIKGYDFVVLENYFEYMRVLCQKLNIEFVDYPVPARSIAIKTYQLFGSNIDKEYRLKIYERVLEVKNLKSTMGPMLFEIVQLNLPEGVEFKVSLFSFEEDEFRYIPDLELGDKRKELEELNKEKK